MEIQASCALIICMLILIYRGEKPNRAMERMVWHELIGLVSLRNLRRSFEPVGSRRRRSAADMQ